MKYIDADLYVEMQIYDDEHEEWTEWYGTIEDLLNHWAEQGCPPIIEVSEDCISREWLETNFQTVCENVRCSECPFDDDDCRLIKFIVDAPSVVPNCSEKPNNCEGEWQRISPAYIYQCSVCGGNVMTQDIECYKYCHQCGAKMKGCDNE